TAKSVVGRIIALFLILILSPLFLILAVFIKITGGPSVIFTQERLREGCKPFRFYKFRTMFDSDENLENHKEYVKKLINGDIEDETYKPRNHPNVTQLGRFLRKTSLDELPQLFNILKGDMSIIGPRPPIPYEVEFYKRWHKRRLDGPQGLTGMWQVYGRSTLPFDESVFLDIYYLMNSSFGLDCYLFFRTIPVLIFGKGGY
ncbi:MAG TPA: sugar transferase, partial [bacterium (Candidatus Stahlbacteria)]|nr:sugar transferase [Candidatus Stahlbacteria bacterium]